MNGPLITIPVTVFFFLLLLWVLIRVWSAGTVCCSAGQKGRHPDLVKGFGKPDILVASTGGLAIWQDGKAPYSKIIIQDEEIPHC